MHTGSTRLLTRPEIVIAVATFLFHVVFLVGLGRWLWSREHYQFFPLVVIASGVLAWFRLRHVVWNQSPRLSFRVAGWGLLAFVCFAIAAIFASNWLGSIAAIFSCWALIWFYGGASIANLLRGPVFFLILGIPLPLNLDLKLIIYLQKMASQLASQFLDLSQVRHDISGVAIITSDRSFMVEEACSGIHSLFSCLCVVVLLGVILEYGLLRILVNISQAVVWVVAANTLRVFLVVYSYCVWGVGLDSGWRHEALGIFTYAIALGMTYSTDRLFQFIVPDTSRRSVMRTGAYDSPDSPVSQLLIFTTDRIERLNKVLDRPRLTERMSLMVLAGVLLVFFAPLSAISYGRIVSHMVSTPAVEILPDPVFVGNMSTTLAKPGSMPATLQNWTLMNVEALDRSPDDPLGEHSTVFTYQGHGLDVSFSVDGYYSGWHDLSYCYTALDWKLKDQSNSQDELTKNYNTRLILYADDGQHLLSHFSCFDSRLMTVRPGQATIGTIKTFENLLERVGWPQLRTDQDPPISPPVFQFQLLCISPTELLDHEQENLRQLFESLSQHALGLLGSESK